MAETYTPNLGVTEIGTGDLVNAWGPVESTNKMIIDNAVAGMASINLPAQSGYPTAVLTFTNGSSSQQLPNRRLVFTGTLTANTVVLFPQGRNFDFAVENSTSGAFSVTLGVNNNSGGILGSSVVVPQGQTMALYGDGTNIVPDANALGGNLTVNGNATITGSLTTSGAVTAGGNVSVTGIVDATTDVQVNGVSTAIPTGIVMPFAGSTAPTGYLLANGQAVSRTTYANLFGIIGTTYGAGDGSTTFNVPDLRGRVAAGYDPGNETGRLTGSTSQGVSAAALGNSGGEQAHTLTQPELPDVNLTSTTSFLEQGGSPQLGGPGAVGAYGTVVVPLGGSDNAHNVVQPTIVLNYIIKA